MTDRVCPACGGVAAAVVVGYETVASRTDDSVRTCAVDCDGEGTAVFVHAE